MTTQTITPGDLRTLLPRRSKRAPEAEAKAQIRQWLEAQGFAVFNMAVSRFGRNNRGKGMGDLHAIVRGRAVWIETKSKTGTARDAQVEFMAKVNAAGGLAFVARSVRDVEVMLVREQAS